jgi:hypothetical protein
MNSPPRGPRLSLNQQYQKIQQQYDPREARRQAIQARIAELQQINPLAQGLVNPLPLAGLGMGAPPANIMTGKVNMGPISVPPGTTCPITMEDIENGNDVARIRQPTGQQGALHDTFIMLDAWNEWVNTCMQNGNAVTNPATNLPVSAGQVDIFTANVQAGGRRGGMCPFCRRKSRRNRHSSRRRTRRANRRR